MAKKKFKKQTKKQLAFYEKVVKRNRDFILNKEGVESFGVGYKFVNGKRTNTICLLVYVDNKQRVARRNRIPKSIEGIPTDVVEIPQVEHAEPAESDSPALLREEIELPDVTAKSEVMYESVASFSSAVTKPRSRSNRGNGPTIARSISPGQSKSP